MKKEIENSAQKELDLQKLREENESLKEARTSQHQIFSSLLKNLFFSLIIHNKVSPYHFSYIQVICPSFSIS